MQNIRYICYAQKNQSNYTNPVSIRYNLRDVLKAPPRSEFGNAVFRRKTSTGRCDMITKNPGVGPSCI